MVRWKLFTAGPRLIEASQEGNIEETTLAQEEEVQHFFDNHAACRAALGILEPSIDPHQIHGGKFDQVACEGLRC
jgi:hypothetical protein